MNKLKKILILIIIIILILVTYIIHLTNKEVEETDIITLYEEEIDTSEETKQNNEFVLDKKDYLHIKKALSKYMSEINVNNSRYYGIDKNDNYTIVVDEQYINSKLYNMLSDDYIKKNSINMDNIREKVYFTQEECFYVPIDIEKKYENNNFKSYGIYGIIMNTDYEFITESCIILNLDGESRTFSIEQLSNKEELKNIKIKESISIEDKDNNTYGTIDGDFDKNIIKEYINVYKRLSLTCPEIIYNNYLEDEYKIKKFGSLDNFKIYIEQNRDAIKSINVQRYNVEKYEDYYQYIGRDQNDKFYIFNVDENMKFKILLDNYTVDLPQFLKEYNAASEVEKIGYNIQKCIEAINDKDYSYLYGKLDNTFKSNNYQTLSYFEEYLKNNLYSNNIVEEDIQTSQEGNIHVYNIKVVNKENTAEKRDVEIIMKLGEGTNFTMSFNIK